MVISTGIFGPYYQWLAAVTDEYIRIHRPRPNDGVHEICRQTIPPSPSMINMHTQPMPVYINATASRPAPGRIHISANPNPLVTPVRPIYGQPPPQPTGPTSIATTFQALQNQSNSTGSLNTPMRWSTSVAGIQSVINPSMNLSAGTGNGAMTMSPPSSTFQPLGHQSIPFGFPSANPAITLSTAGSAFQPVAHQSIPLRSAAVNPTMTSLPPASAFIPVGQQSIHLTPGSVNQPMTMSGPPSSFQTVQNESIGASSNASISMSAVPPSILQGVPNEGITVAASPVNPPNPLQQGTMSPHANQFQSMTTPIGSQPNSLQQGTMSPHGNQFQSMPTAIGSQPNSLQQATVSPHSNQFQSMATAIGSQPNSLQQGTVSPHANQFQSMATAIGSQPNSLQQGTVSPHVNQFQSIATAIGSQPNPLEQGIMSPQGNQFASVTNPIGSQPNPAQQGTMSPQANQFNPIGSPAMTIQELKMGQSTNMSPSVHMTVPSEVQMGEMTPTPTGQQVPIHILKKLDANQLQQLQSGSPVPITENQLQEIQGGPVDDSQMDLFESGDEDQIRNEEPMKKSEHLELHKNPIDSRKHFTPESFKMKYAPSGSIEYDNEVEVIEDDEPKDLEILPEDFDSSEDSDGDPTYKPDTDDDDDTDEEEIPPISSPFQRKSNANDGRSKSAPAESSIMQGKYRYVKINSDFLDGLRNFDNQNQFRMSNISDSPIVDEYGFEITVNDILRKDDHESDNSPLFLTELSISASKKQQNVLKSSTSTKRKLDNRPLDTPPPKVKASARSKLSINNDDKDTTKFTVKSGGMSGGLLKVREDMSKERNDSAKPRHYTKGRNKSKVKLDTSESTAKPVSDEQVFKKPEIPKRHSRSKSPVLPAKELRVGLDRIKTLTPPAPMTNPVFLTSENEEPEIPDCSYGKSLFCPVGPACKNFCYFGKY